MDNTLKEQLQTVIDKYGLTYKSYDDEEDLAPSNVEYDLIDDILDAVSETVYEFIKVNSEDEIIGNAHENLELLEADK